jgi:CRP/FNR family cyclic AMP-dependent transcriptional regulator
VTPLPQQRLVRADCPASLPANLPGADPHRAAGLRLLAANPSFREWPLALRLEWLSACAVWHVPRGQVLAEQGTVPDVCFGLLQGAAERSVRDATGSCSVLDLAEPGQWFCAESLLLNAPLPFRLRTAAPAVFLVMRRSVLREMQARHAGVSQALVDLGWRFSLRLIEQAGIRAEGTLAIRVRRMLACLASRFGVTEEGWTRIDLNLSQVELAALVGCSRQRANIEIQKLQGAGELRLRNRRYSLRTPVGPKA